MANEEIRRSSRSKKQSEFFTIQSHHKDQEFTRDIDRDHGDVNNLLDESIDVRVDSDDDGELLLDSKPKKKIKKTKQSENTRNSKPKSISITNGNKQLEDMSLLDAIKSIDQSYKSHTNEQSISNDLNNIAEIWIDNFRDNRTHAIVDLVNFILLCAGAKTEWIAEDVDLEALEPSELDVLLKELTDELTNITLASEPTDNMGLYPLVDSTKKTKLKTNVRLIYSKFWKALANRLLQDIYSVQVENESEFGTKQRFAASRARGSSFDILNVIIDQLVSLSSVAAYSIRDAITEALGSVGHQMVLNVLDANEQLDFIQRQLSVEEKKTTSTSSSKRSNKYSSYSKQKEMFSKAIIDTNKLVVSIFTSIFVHRFKDSHDSIRVVCGTKLTDWMLSDPSQFIQDEYLKYIFWMTYDISATVRKDSLKLVYRLVNFESLDDEQKEIIRLVVVRFTDRFIEIASADIDDSVCIEMFVLLRSLQTKGFIDHIEEELDLIDQVVFDPTASYRLRQECLMFVMEHTEGFEELDSSEFFDTGRNVLEESSSSSKRTMKRKPVPIYDQQTMATRKRHAFQLETLAEFAEYHLLKESLPVKSLDKVDMLAEACLMVPNFNLLFDWSVTITLLLRESDDSISTTLSDTLTDIVLRLFLKSVRELRNFITKSSSSFPVHSSSKGFSAAANMSLTSASSTTFDESVLKQATKQTASFPKKSTHAISGGFNFSLSSLGLQQAWESLREHLTRDVSRLLTRFRDNSFQLNQIATLLECCAYSPSFNNTFNLLLKNIHDFYLTTSHQPLIQTLAGVLRAWKDCQDESGSMGTFQGSVVSVIDELSEEILVKFRDSLSILRGLSSSALLEKKVEPVSRARRSSGETSSTVTASEESFVLCSQLITKVKWLWMISDCRSTLGEKELANFVDDMIEASDLLLAAYESTTSTHTTSIDSEVQSKLRDGIVDSIKTVYLILLWLTKDLFSLGKNIQLHPKPSPVDIMQNDNSEDEVPEPGSDGMVVISDLQADIDILSVSIMAIRDKLQQVLTTWLSFADKISNVNELDEESLGSELSPIQRYLEREAFSILGELRALFPMSLQQYHGIDAFAYQLPQETLGRMRQVFEIEGKLVKDEIQVYLNRINDLQDSQSKIALIDQGNSQSSYQGLFPQSSAVASSNHANAYELDQYQHQIDDLVKTLIQFCLKPLAQAFYYDTANVNRRQASAIMMFHLLDPPIDKISEFIKVFSKRFKDHDMIRYLEIQLVTLKGHYSDSLESVISTLLSQEKHQYYKRDKFNASEVFEDDVETISSSDVTQLNAAYNDNFDKLLILSKKLSNTLGVGKVKDLKTVQALHNFLKTGIDFSLSEPTNLLFLHALIPYLKFLPSSILNELNNYFHQCVSDEDCQRVINEMRNILSKSMNALVTSLETFQSHFPGYRPLLSGRVKRSVTPLIKSSVQSTGSIEKVVNRKTAPMAKRNGNAVKRSRQSILSPVSEEDDGDGHLDEAGLVYFEDEELRPSQTEKPRKKTQEDSISVPKKLKPNFPPLQSEKLSQTSQSRVSRPSRKAKQSKISYFEGENDEYSEDANADDVDAEEVETQIAESNQKARKVFNKVDKDKKFSMMNQIKKNNISLGLRLEELEIEEDADDDVNQEENDIVEDEDFDAFITSLPEYRLR